jgi:hypothetical protein
MKYRSGPDGASRKGHLLCEEYTCNSERVSEFSKTKEASGERNVWDSAANGCNLLFRGVMNKIDGILRP